MTESVPPRSDAQWPVDADSRAEAGADPLADGAAARASRWALPVGGILLAVLCTGALVAGGLAPGSVGAIPAVSTTPVAPIAVASTSPGSPEASAATTAGSAKRNDRPISQLADPAWITRTAAEAGIPERALAAYAGAALATAQLRPNCGIGWNTLAAIGQVESDHGRVDGAHLDSRGVATPTIIGIPLDGNGTAKIPDSDHGQYDGDSTWDRAVGPMQFIPSTWVQAGQDGNEDGVKDPNQIDDAALTAAVYLCNAGGDLSVAQNWITAIRAYNDSIDYNNEVAAIANRYATLR